jgi:hypothetical protein
MMAVMLKVNSLNCIALKRKEFSFYVAFTVFFIMCTSKVIKVKSCTKTLCTPCSVHTVVGKGEDLEQADI